MLKVNLILLTHDGHERVEVADVEALPRDVGEVLDEPRSVLLLDVHADFGGDEEAESVEPLHVGLQVLGPLEVLELHVLRAKKRERIVKYINLFRIIVLEYSQPGIYGNCVLAWGLWELCVIAKFHCVQRVKLIHNMEWSDKIYDIIYDI